MRETAVLLLSGSTDPRSAASRLAGAAKRELALLDAAVTEISLADFVLPLHDGDAEPPSIPQAVQKLRGLFRAHQAAMIVTPEWNATVPALLSNALEWIGREGVPRGMVFLVASASADLSGGRGALSALRAILGEGLGATVLGGVLALSSGNEAFDAMERLADPRTDAALKSMVRELLRLARQGAT